MFIFREILLTTILPISSRYETQKYNSKEEFEGSQTKDRYK